MAGQHAWLRYNELVGLRERSSLREETLWGESLAKDASRRAEDDGMIRYLHYAPEAELVARRRAIKQAQIAARQAEEASRKGKEVSRKGKEVSHEAVEVNEWLPDWMRS